MDDSRNFNSLSVKDLLDAREAYHVHLAHKDGVYATAIGRYLMRPRDTSGAKPDPNTPFEPRRLDNTEIRDESWPCVQVFVRKMKAPDHFKDQHLEHYVPSRLYLPDGRVVPTCVIEVDPDEGAQLSPNPPTYQSDLMGGGYAISVDVQDKRHVGSVGCLVTDGDTVYALTNRHVCGEPGRVINFGHTDPLRRIGLSDKKQIGKKPFARVYPGWPGERVLSNLDAGLIRIDTVRGWTAQVYGIGEMDDLWDLNVDSFSLDVINCPVAAFGANSGKMQGKIIGLFYRYKTVGGYEYVSDFVIGPRNGDTPVNNWPGDSGTVWFVDQPVVDADEKTKTNAGGAHKFRPFALEWGGQVLLAPGAKKSTQLALATCLSTVCRELQVELIADWNTGHPEYWGEWGHTKIGAYACELIDDAYPDLKALMVANQESIGLPDKELGGVWKKATSPDAGPAPLADVADLVWRNTRGKADESNHFADMDKPDSHGETLLDKCVKKENVTPEVWNAYYADIGENDKRGALPIRVWQMYDEAVGYLKPAQAGAKPDVLRFVTAVGLMAHYVGDACQPLHVSQYHHGRDLTDKKHAKVHSIYETTMIGLHGKDLLPLVAAAAPGAVDPVEGDPASGQDVAFAVTELMRRTFKRLPPLTIVDLFDQNMGRNQKDVMWTKLKDPTAACMKDGALTLARIWEAAWRAADLEGKGIAPTAFPYAQMEALYRQKCFVPSYMLNKITTGPDGKLVLPPCTETAHDDAAPVGGKDRRPRKPKGSAAASAPKPKKKTGMTRKAVKKTAKKSRKPRRH